MMPLPARAQLRPSETPGLSLDKEMRFGEKQQNIISPFIESNQTVNCFASAMHDHVILIKENIYTFENPMHYATMLASNTTCVILSVLQKFSN